MGGEEIGPARSRHPLRGGGGGGIKGGDGGEWSELGKAAERREGRAGPEAAAATMQEIIASVDHIKFDLEIAVEQQLGAQPLPFPGMDSEHGARRVGDADSDRGASPSRGHGTLTLAQLLLFRPGTSPCHLNSGALSLGP